MKVDVALLEAITGAATEPPADYVNHQGGVLITFHNASGKSSMPLTLKKEWWALSWVEVTPQPMLPDMAERQSLIMD
jgi:hypothetical protein